MKVESSSCGKIIFCRFRSLIPILIRKCSHPLSLFSHNSTASRLLFTAMDTDRDEIYTIRFKPVYRLVETFSNLRKSLTARNKHNAARYSKLQIPLYEFFYIFFLLFFITYGLTLTKSSLLPTKYF